MGYDVNMDVNMEIIHLKEHPNTHTTPLQKQTFLLPSYCPFSHAFQYLLPSTPYIPLTPTPAPRAMWSLYTVGLHV